MQKKLNNAINFLKEQAGVVSCKLLLARAKELGISDSTLWRAKIALQLKLVRYRTDSESYWAWNCTGKKDVK